MRRRIARARLAQGADPLPAVCQHPPELTDGRAKLRAAPVTLHENAPRLLDGIEAIIFDLDDTLIPYLRAHAAYLQHLSTAISLETGIAPEQIDAGLKHLSAEVGLNALGDRIDMHPELVRHYAAMRPKQLPSQALRRVLEEADSIFRSLIQPSDAVVRTLDALREQGMPMYLFTEGAAHDTVRKLEMAGIGAYFTEIYCPLDDRKGARRRDVTPTTRSPLWQKIRPVPGFPKDSPAIVRHVAARITPHLDRAERREKVLLVGNSVIRDVRNADRAGLRAALTREYYAGARGTVRLARTIGRHSSISVAKRQAAVNTLLQRMIYRPPIRLERLDQLLEAPCPPRAARIAGDKQRKTPQTVDGENSLPAPTPAPTPAPAPASAPATPSAPRPAPARRATP